jgi:hypothetical protein
MTGTRGRLTPVDVILVGASLAVFTFLSEPLYNLLDSTALSTEVELLFRMIPPALVAMLIFAVYRTSLIGGPS